MARTGDNLYKRQDGRWEGRYIKGRKPDGRIIYGSIYHRKYQEAKRLLFEIKFAHRENYMDFGKHRSQTQTVNDWFIYWLDQKKNQLKGTTFQSYESKVMNHVFPFFMDVQLTQLTAEVIQQWVETLSKQLSNNSLHAVFRIFKQGVNAAVAGNKLYRNPIQSVLLPKQTISDARSFSKRDQQQLERACQTFKELPMLIALDTGMRISEIAGLQWRDIDWTNRTIKVQRIVQRIKGKDKTHLVLQLPKTKTSKRVIPLTQRLFNLLGQHKQNEAQDFIFSGRKGQPLDPRTIRYRFEQLKKQCHVEDLPFHALRHTFATRCIEAGINIPTVSDLLGHSSIKMTLDIYTHSFLSEKRKAIEQLEKTS